MLDAPLLSARSSYGPPRVVRRRPPADPEPIDVGGLRRTISLRDERIEDADMPGGPEVDLAGARIGPLASLVHDEAYFDAIDRAPPHGGVLRGLRAY